MKEVLCRSCNYVGDINTYKPCFTSMWNDCRCPKCGSTDNQHNDDYQESLSKGLDEIEKDKLA